MKIDFIRQLSAIKKAFLAYAAASSVKVDRKTFEINIGNGYLSMRVECKDGNGDIIAFRQEIEMGGIATYQNALIPLDITKEY